MYSFTLKVIVFLTVNGLCNGFSLKILMDRVDNVENRIEIQNKIRRQEMAAVYEKMSVIDSLEAKVKMLMDIVGTQTQPGARNKEKEEIHETGVQKEEIRDLRITIFDAFRREKTRNMMLQKEYKRLKVELMTTLNNHTLGQSNAVNDMIEKVNSDINTMNLTVINVKSTMANVENQVGKYTDFGKELVRKIEQVEENITSLRDDFHAKVNQVQNNVDAISEKHDLHWNISFKPESCLMLKQTGLFSTVYELWSSSLQSNFRVYCDQETDGGGWIVFQRRKDSSVDFNRNWTDYKLGFGDLNGEFWLGNEYLSALTSDGDHELRIDMEDFDGNKAYAKYSHFKIHPESEKYLLEVNGYSGNAKDSLKYHNKQPFSTKDNWNGISEYCKKYNAGWWFHDCFYSNLNGEYFQRNPPSPHLGIIWYHWLGPKLTIKFTEMKFRKTKKIVDKN